MRLWCWIFGHRWTYEDCGDDDMPISAPDYCRRCGRLRSLAEGEK